MDEPTKTPEEETKQAEEEQARAAKRQHDEKVAGLQAKVDEAKRSPEPKTDEETPTPRELAFLDKLRKIKQFSRNSLMLNLLLDRQVQGRDLVNGVYGIIEHQENQDQFAQRLAQQTGRDFEKARTTINDLTKSTEEGEDELRQQIAELRAQARDRNMRLEERLGYLDDLVFRLFMYLVQDREWQGRPITRRRRRDRPAVPRRPTLEQHLADNTRVEDLPDRLRKAAEATVDLATRVATAGAKDCEACEREEIAMPCPECAAPAIPEPLAVVPPGNPEALERVRSEIRQAVEDGLTKGKGEPS